jgi:hypothetical protein
MINRGETIFGRVMNRMNHRSDGEEGSAPCFSSFGVGATAWCHDGDGKGREVEPKDPEALQRDEEPRCWLAR